MTLSFLLIISMNSIQKIRSPKIMNTKIPLHETRFATPLCEVQFGSLDISHKWIKRTNASNSTPSSSQHGPMRPKFEVQQPSSTETFQHKFLRKIAKASWYVTSFQLRKDLDIETVHNYIRRKAERYFDRLHRHPNSKSVMLSDDSNNTRRLRRQYIHDLIN